MKKLALAASVTAFIAAPAVALAGPETFTLKTSTAATKSGTKAKPAAQTLTTTITASPAGNYAAARAIVSLDKHFKFNTSKFPKCTQAKVKAGGSGCPTGSRVGSGKATAIVSRRSDGTPLGTTIASNLSVRAYNAANNTLFILVRGTNPVKIQEVMVGKLKTASGKYGRKLDVAIPEALQSVSGFRPTLTKFTLAVGSTHRGLPYVQTTGCSAGDWSFKAQVFYTDGTDKTGVAGTNCKSG